MDSGKIIGSIGGNEVAEQVYGSVIGLVVTIVVMSIWYMYLRKEMIKFAASF